MNNWPTKKLGEICEIISGFSFKADEFNEKGLGLPVIRIGDLNNLKRTEKFYNGQYDSNYIVDKGDVLIGLSGTIIAGMWQGEKALLNQRVVKLTNFKESDKKFIGYILPLSLKKLSEEISRSAVKNVLKHHLENLQIPLPPLPIQQKIVKILDTIQEAINIQEEIIEKTKELKKSLMKELFKYGGPSFRKGRKLKKTEIGEIPENWKVVKLGEENLFEIKLGGTPKTTFQDYWGGDIPWITPNDLSKLTTPYIFETERTITKKGLEAGSNLLSKDSIIISTRAPIGYVAILGRDMAFNQGCKGIGIKNHEKVFSPFLYYFLLTRTKQLHELGSGSTFRELSTNDLKSFLIPLPNMEEQQEIVEILQTIDQKIEIERKKKELYEELFKTMLNKIMNQEIDVGKIEI